MNNNSDSKLKIEIKEEVWYAMISKSKDAVFIDKIVNYVDTIVIPGLQSKYENFVKNLFGKIVISNQKTTANNLFFISSCLDKDLTSKVFNDIKKRFSSKLISLVSNKPVNYSEVLKCIDKKTPSYSNEISNKLELGSLVRIFKGPFTNLNGKIIDIIDYNWFKVSLKIFSVYNNVVINRKEMVLE